MGVILAGAATTPPTPTAPAGPTHAEMWPGLAGMTWTGADGRTWDLLDPAGGVLLMQGDTTGLDDPDYTRWTSVSPSTPGSHLRGGRREPRDVFWRLDIRSHDGSAAWLRLHDAFRAGLDFERAGVWEVVTQLGRRRLRMTYSGSSDNINRDPTRYGRHVFGFHFVADDPDWRGDVIERSWSIGGVKRAFLPKSGESGFFLSDTFVGGKATVTNPGHLPAYPTWTLTGPLMAGTKVGVGGLVTTITSEIPAGESVTIVTQPSALAIRHSSGASWLTGDHITGDIAFAPIPAGRDVELSVTMAGRGSVSAAFEPGYLRAL